MEAFSTHSLFELNTLDFVMGDERKQSFSGTVTFGALLAIKNIKGDLENFLVALKTSFDFDHPLKKSKISKTNPPFIATFGTKRNLLISGY